MRTSLQSGFSVESTSSKRDFWGAFLILPLFLRAGPGPASPANFSIPHRSTSWPDSHWRHMIEWKDHGFESQTGLVSLDLLLTHSVGPLSSRPQGSKYPEFINCIAVVQVIFVLPLCFTLIEYSVNSGRYFSKYQPQNAISLYLPCPHLQKKRNFSDWMMPGKPSPKMPFLNHCFLCHSISHFFSPSSHCYSSWHLANYREPWTMFYSWMSTSQSSHLPRGNTFGFTK